MAESALFKKFQEEQAKKDAEYKAWEADQWKQHGDQWTKEGYKRTEDSNNAWGSSWSFKNPVINPPTPPTNVETEVETKVENKPETKVETPATSKGFSFVGQKFYNTEDDFIKDFDTQYKQYALQNKTAFGQPQFTENTSMSLIRGLSDMQSKNLQGYNNALQSAKNLYNYNKPASFLSNRWFGELVGLSEEQPTYTLINKNGGTMNKVNYFQQGGSAPQQDIQKQVVALVQAAMSGDQKATQTVNQIMQAAKQGDQQAAQLAQMIQQVAKQMQGQATAAKWGSKLQYIRSLKFAKGGKTCPACMKDGGNTPEKPKDKKQKMHVNASDTVHVAGKAKSLTNSDGSRVDPRFPAYTAKDYQNDKKTKDGQKRRMKADLVSSEKCGGTAPKAKKHYFGGWL